MLGIVTVDRQLDGYPSAIWVTNQSAPTEASHSNAVVLDVDEDPSALAKIRSLTRGNIVVKTAGSDIRDLSIEGGGRVLADIQEMVQETRLFQREIRQLVADYRKRTRTSLVDPDFPTPPGPSRVPCDFRRSTHAGPRASELRRRSMDLLVEDRRGATSKNSSA